MKQRGFTLIELVIVIVILGILAVTAAPRFLDLTGDARESTVRGAKGAIAGAMQIVYAKSAIEGEEKTASASDATSQVVVNGNTIETDFGYPDAEATTTMADLAAWADFSDDEWTLVAGTGSAAEASPAAGAFGVHPEGVTPDFSVTTTGGDSCHLLYTEATNANTPPVVSIVTGGC